MNFILDSIAKGQKIESSPCYRRTEISIFNETKNTILHCNLPYMATTI